MKFLQVILTLSLLFVVPSLVVESSSSSDNNLVRNITRGSSLSLNDTNPYWFSPSGILAFGFYPLPNSPDRYAVGTWLVKSPSKTLVWKATPDDLLLHKSSSLLFTTDGKLMLRIMPDDKEKPLIPDVQEPALYAVMHDDGNFVLYGLDSQIVWQSFDYPSGTILGGQKLKPGIDLISGNHRLSVQQTDGLVAIYNMDGIMLKVVSDEIEGSVSSPVTLNLDSGGNLYVVGSDDVVLKYLYRNKNKQPKQREEGSTVKEDVHLYRATLDSEGNLNLYEERTTGNIRTDRNEESSSIRVLLAWQPARQISYQLRVLMFTLYIIVGLLYCFGPFLLAVVRESREQSRRDKRAEKKNRDLESGEETLVN